MGYRFFFIRFSSFFVRFPLCKMFVQICFRTDGCCTKFEHVKHSGTDRQPEGHSSIVYITYVHMLRRCVFVPPPLPPHFVSMSPDDDDDDDDGYGWATRTHNKPTHNTRVHKSIHHFRSPIPFLSPFWFNIYNILANCARAEILWAD